MKIAFFGFSTLEYAGGCEKNFMSLGRWLKNKGHEVSFVTATNDFNNLICTILQQGKHVSNLSKNDLEETYNIKVYKQFGLIDLLFPTKRNRDVLILLKKADHIYARNEILEAIILKYFLKIDPKKIVFGFHTPIYYPVSRNIKSKFHNWLYKSKLYLGLISNSKVRALVLTTHDKEVLAKHNPNQNIVVIPNPINIIDFAPKKYYKESIYKIFYIGRMTEQKGIDILAETIGQLSKTPEFDRMNFTFIGNGDKEFYLMDLAKKFKNCHFLGFKTSTSRFYSQADLTVVPSRWEGFPYSVLEAQACGVPVIASNIPGCRDIILDSKTGWLIAANDSSGLSKKILEAYDMWHSEYQSFVDIGKNARINTEQKYSEEYINKKIENFLLTSNKNEKD